jgi:hypothetical protein
MRENDILGPISQNAFVVANLDDGIAYWTRRMHVGPFVRFPQIVYVQSEYRGVSQPIDTDVAIAYSGTLMIELIQPRGPSIFAEFLRQGGLGVHHLAAFTQDMAAAQALIESRGGIKVQSGRVAEGSSVAYYEMPGGHMPVMELAYLKPDILALFDAVRAAAERWDGTTPTMQP